MFAVDTNILVYAHFELYPQHARARQFVEQRLLSGPATFCLSWQVVYEYLRLTTHPKVHARPLTLKEAWADLQPYLERGELLGHTPAHLQVLGSLVETETSVTGNFVHDFHYAALLREHGIKTIITADSDFRRFAFLTVVDPTREDWTKY